MMNIKFGCNPDPKDIYNEFRFLRPLRRPELDAIPTEYYIPAATSVPVYDQGPLGSCTSFGSGTAFQIRQQQVTGSSFTVAHLPLYQCELVHDNQNRGDDVGSSLSTAAWVLENKGAVPESEYPYDVANFGKQIPAEILADALKDELLQAVKLDAADLPTTINNMKAAISNNYPVMFGMTVFNSFVYNTGSDGNVPYPGSVEDDEIAGGHALCFSGHDDTHENPGTDADGNPRPNGAFFGPNSWGITWGWGGKFYCGYDIINNINDGFGDAWALMAGTEFNSTNTVTIR